MFEMFRTPVKLDTHMNDDSSSSKLERHLQGYINFLLGQFSLSRKAGPLHGNKREELKTTS
jgi:hypothetical protein